MKPLIWIGLGLALAWNVIGADCHQWVQYEGTEGPGKGKHLVFITGDEEYRSEEGMPMLAKILAKHHGFKCTVLFALNPETGEIDPNNQTNIVGMFHVAQADMVILFTRFRELPDSEMKYFADYVDSGKPILAFRTATHAFAYSRNKESPYARYSYNSRDWNGGFGRQVLGETWISHHGRHGSESTRGVVNGVHAKHPILKGVKDIWGPTDVYGTRELHGNAKVLVYGQVLTGMKPEDPPKPFATIMPLIWVNEYASDSGKVSRMICSTIGSSTDLQSEDLRRLSVNACYWGLGLEDQIPDRSQVDVVGEYHPTPFGFNAYTKGIKPADHLLK